MAAKATYIKLSLSIFNNEKSTRQSMLEIATSGNFNGVFSQKAFSEAATYEVAATELGFTEDFILNDETFSQIEEKEIRECCLEMQKSLSEKIINTISDSANEATNSYLNGLKLAHNVMKETLASY